MSEEIKCGAWQFQEMTPCNLPKEVAAAFNKAVGGIIGVGYMPVLYVASQLVAGMNYCIICKTTAMTNPPLVGCKAVYIYADLSGNAHITKIDDVIR